jgi:hypothetical protein
MFSSVFGDGVVGVGEVLFLISQLGVDLLVWVVVDFRDRVMELLFVMSLLEVAEEVEWFGFGLRVLLNFDSFLLEFPLFLQLLLQFPLLFPLLVLDPVGCFFPFHLYIFLFLALPLPP